MGHEKLDVYRMALGSVAWVFEHSEKLTGAHRHARDQWLRASQSIPLNIAEGNGKTAEADRSRYLEIARRSVLEYAAMLSRLGKRGYSVREESPVYRIDFDSDSDFDPEGTNSQQPGAGHPATRPVVEPEGGDQPQLEAEGRRP